jgi:hypothetical protein
LRLMFNDVEVPEFELSLFDGTSNATSQPKNASDAVRLGRKWLSHIDAVLKRGPGPAYPIPAPQAGLASGNLSQGA